MEKTKNNTSKSEILHKMRNYLNRTKMGGSRPNTSGSNRNSKLTKRDQLKIDACYAKETELYVDMTLEELERMQVNIGNEDEQPEVRDGNGVLLTGTRFIAWRDSLYFKRYEAKMKEKKEEEEKLKNEVFEEEIKKVETLPNNL